MPAADSPNSFLASDQFIFGIVALQMSFITRETLIAAFDAWIQDKSRTLPDILQSQNALTADDCGLLERLVAKFFEKHGGNAERSLAALSSISVWPALERLENADLEASLAKIADSAGEWDQSTETFRVEPVNPLGRFRILRRYAKGALGQVSVALDHELNREVALKEILPQHSDNPVSRERFVLEAKITGGLEHPGIVPVYALGHDDAGRPFYAMRFVKGDSLKTAIETYHRPDNPNRQEFGARQLELRRLLGRFIDVCNAIEYAHSRGVLHRDLKPGNILVGKYGETLVVDWGLAKVVGRKEVVSDEATLRPTSTLSSSGQTKTGSAIGTPAYMSPEQAAGRLDDLSPASDVYSLGATLYHLLCGRPPFEKGDVGVVLEKVERGDFPPPRSLAPDVPRPLEAICLKAMSASPTARYPSARALANELEHWLADEPVAAVPDAVGDLLSRYARKHRGGVRAGAVAVALVAVVSTIAAIVVNEQRREKTQLAEAERSARSEAEQLAEDKTALAESERQARTKAERLAAERTELAESERAARKRADDNQKLADERAIRLQWTIARHYFARGAHEYSEGRLNSGLADLTRALAILPSDDVLQANFKRVLLDRCTHGGRQSAPPLRHGASVNRVVFGPDGTRVATGSRDKTARLWDSETGAPIGEAMRHEGEVASVAFSPDGTRVATASVDGSAKLWDAHTGAPLGEPMRHEGEVASVAFSPDGTRVATASRDKTARLWDAHTGAPLGEAMRHEREVASVAFSPDGKRIATASTDKAARLWDARAGTPLGEVMWHWSKMNDIAFSSDGTRLATARFEVAAQLWDARTGAPLGEAMRHESSVSRVAFSPDGTRVATASDDKTARLWDAHTGAPLGKSMRHAGRVSSAAFSPDGTRVATASDDRTARLWDARTGDPIGEAMPHEARVSSAAFSRDGTRVATASDDKTARLWDAHTGAPLGETMRHEARVSSATFSLDGARVATVAEDNTTRFWDAHTGAPLGETPKRENSEVESVALSPDGTHIATVNGDKTVQFTDARTGAPLGEAMRHDDRLVTLRFSPDGARLATASGRIVRLWDAYTGASLGEPMRHERPVERIEFGPDGTCVATSTGMAAWLWDAVIPDLDRIPPETLRKTVELWTGCRSDSDGTIHELSLEEIEEVRRQLGTDDPLLEFVAEREKRRRASNGAGRRAAGK